jgi:hypothetical protein
MSLYHAGQSVRIVRTYATPQAVGMACILIRRAVFVTSPFGPEVHGWETDLFPLPGWGGLCVHEDNIEPIRYLPSPEDFVNLERVPPEEVRETVRA